MTNRKNAAKVDDAAKIATKYRGEGTIREALAKHSRSTREALANDIRRLLTREVKTAVEVESCWKRRD